MLIFFDSLANDTRNRGKFIDIGGPLSARSNDKERKVPRLNLEVHLKKPKKTDRSKHDSARNCFYVEM